MTNYLSAGDYSSSCKPTNNKLTDWTGSIANADQMCKRALRNKVVFLLLFGLVIVCSFTLVSLSTGCVIRPMIASDMYGESATKKPAFTFRKTEKAFEFEAGANTVGSIDVVPTEHGVEYHAELNSTGIETIMDAQGNMIPKMDNQRLADFQRVIEQERILSLERQVFVNRMFGLMETMTPLLMQSLEAKRISESQNNTSDGGMREQIAALLQDHTGQQNTGTLLSQILGEQLSPGKLREILDLLKEAMDSENKSQSSETGSNSD